MSVFDELNRIEQSLKLLIAQRDAERKKAQEDVKLAYDLMSENRKATFELINYLAQFLPSQQKINLPSDNK